MCLIKWRARNTITLTSIWEWISPNCYTKNHLEPPSAKGFHFGTKKSGKNTNDIVEYIKRNKMLTSCLHLKTCIILTVKLHIYSCRYFSDTTNISTEIAKSSAHSGATNMPGMKYTFCQFARLVLASDAVWYEGDIQFWLARRAVPGYWSPFKLM